MLKSENASYYAQRLMDLQHAISFLYEKRYSEK